MKGYSRFSIDVTQIESHFEDIYYKVELSARICVKFLFFKYYINKVIGSIYVGSVYISEHSSDDIVQYLIETFTTSQRKKRLQMKFAKELKKK